MYMLLPTEDISIQLAILYKKTETAKAEIQSHPMTFKPLMVIMVKSFIYHSDFQLSKEWIGRQLWIRT